MMIDGVIYIYTHREDLDSNEGKYYSVLEYDKGLGLGTTGRTILDRTCLHPLSYIWAIGVSVFSIL